MVIFNLQSKKPTRKWKHLKLTFFGHFQSILGVFKLIWNFENPPDFPDVLLLACQKKFDSPFLVPLSVSSPKKAHPE